MRYVKWAIIGVFWLLVAAFLHYTLPQHDIARITGTYEDRVDVSESAWAWATPPATTPGASSEKLVFFIQTRQANGDIMVYRNEDTGWGWPPYFKFDTANLHAEAASFVSTEEAPKWFVIKHYGWRNEFISIFPNAVSLRQIDSPDTRVIPWVTIIILLGLGAVFWAVRVRYVRFRERRLEPALDRIGDRIAGVK